MLDPVPRHQVFPESFDVLLPQLLQAEEYARATGLQTWQFALELEILLEANLLKNDIRLLLSQSVLEKRSETTVSGDGARRFSEQTDALIDPSSCFILGARGRELFLDTYPDPQHGSSTSPPERQLPATHASPVWDAGARELIFNGRLVKRFKVRAANQEKILAAFQEEQWPSRIDDPLPLEPGQIPSQRLRDTVKCLNRRHLFRTIRFHSDGTGQGVRWCRVSG